MISSTITAEFLLEAIAIGGGVIGESIEGSEIFF